MNDSELLLKIKRDYSKDEAVSILLKELSNIKFKNGELISEIEELKSEIEQLRQIPTSNGKTKRQWLQDEIVKGVNEENKLLKKNNAELKRTLQTYKDKYYCLLVINQNK